MGIDVGFTRYRPREVNMQLGTGSPIRLGQGPRSGAFVALLLVACGSDGGASPGEAGSGGNQTATGGVVGSSGGSGNPSGGVGSGGVPSATGGAVAAGGTGPATGGGGTSSGGTPASGGAAGGGGTPSLADVDLTLGGFNQDLPAPSKDCLAATTVPTVACFSARGEWLGEQIDISCDEGDGPSSAGTQPPDRFVGCSAKLPSGDDIHVSVRLGGTLVGPTPKAFAFSSPPDSTAHTFLDMTDVTKLYSNHVGETFELAATYDETTKVAGLADDEPGIRAGTMSEIIKGTFAVTLAPKASCPAGTSFECKSIRLRGTFQGRTVYKL
jgi:hypothetical protein